MNYKLISNCKDCDAKLWSDYSKSLGYCPECKLADSAYLDATYLEAQLENLTNENSN